MGPFETKATMKRKESLEECIVSNIVSSMSSIEEHEHKIKLHREVIDKFEKVKTWQELEDAKMGRRDSFQDLL